MGYFSNLDLEKSEIADLEDMLKEYPNLPFLSKKEISNLIEKLSWNMNHYRELSEYLKNQVEILTLYEETLKEAGRNVE